MTVDIKYRSENQAYHDAKRRCNNVKHKQYSNYGGRGIKFNFKSFWEFLECVGYKPKGFCLDRIDNNGHYEVGNVRWVSYTESNLNKRSESKARKHSSTKVQYVSWHKVKQKWSVQYRINGKQKTLFYSDIFEEACAFVKGLVNV